MCLLGDNISKRLLCLEVMSLLINNFLLFLVILEFVCDYNSY